MGTAIFDESTFLLREWIPSGPAPRTRPGLVGVTTATPPDARTQRYDGAGGIRAATRVETDAWDQITRDVWKTYYDSDEGVEKRATMDVIRTLLDPIWSALLITAKTRSEMRDEYFSKLDDLTL